jgi:hypothetical protein
MFSYAICIHCPVVSLTFSEPKLAALSAFYQNRFSKHQPFLCIFLSQWFSQTERFSIVNSDKHEYKFLYEIPTILYINNLKTTLMPM